MQSLHVLTHAMQGYKFRYGAGLAALAVSSIFLFAAPLILRLTMDSILAGHSPQLPSQLQLLWHQAGGQDFFLQRLWLPAAALSAAAALQGGFAYIQGHAVTTASEHTAAALRVRMYDHIQKLPFLDMGTLAPGDLIQRCTSDIDTIRRFISLEAPEIMRSLSLAAIAIPMMLRMHTGLAVISLFLVPVLFAFSLYFFLRVQKAFEAMDESEARMSTMLQESITGVRVVRAFGRQAFEEEKFSSHNNDFHRLTFRVIRNMAMYWSVSTTLSILQSAALLVGGTFLIIQGSTTIGTVTAFITIQTFLLFPLRMLGRVLANMGQMTVALKRLDEILNIAIESDLTAGARPPITGTVRVQDVHFSYPDGTTVLNGIHFELHPGESVGLLGATGAGKSTLLHLLVRLLDYTSGCITIDGHEITTIAKQHLRSGMALVLQEPFLFTRTIKENLSLARSSARDEEIVEAAQAACFHEVVNHFEHGYATAVGERGVTLSGGQKQRLAIARSLLRNTPILLLDDSMSAVDTETEHEIRQALKDRRHTLTTMVVSHRISTLAACDRILVLDSGRIVESGTHEELTHIPGLYQRVWNMQRQFATEEEMAL